jgi:hypothetical protein
MGLGILGLATAGGAGQGLEAVLKRRLMEQQMQQQAAQQAEEMALRRASLDAETARNTTQDAWQRSVWEAQQARLGKMDERQQTLDEEIRLGKAREALTESYAPDDMIGPGAAEQAAKIAPELVRLMPGQTAMQPGQPTGVPGQVVKGEAQGGIGTVAARPITSTIGPTVGTYKGTATQRRQVGMDARATEASERADKLAEIAQQRLDATMAHNADMLAATNRRIDTTASNRGELSLQQRLMELNRLQDDWASAYKPVATVKNAAALADAAMRQMKSGAVRGETVLVKFENVLDPNSVVREGEVNRALQAQGLYDRMDAMWNRLKSGGMVSPAQLQEYADAIKIMADVTEKSIAGPVRDRLRKRAEFAGIDPELIWADAPAAQYPTPAPSPSPNPQPTPSPKPSSDAKLPFSYVHPNGKTYQFKTQADMDDHKRRTGGR